MTRKMTLILLAITLLMTMCPALADGTAAADPVKDAAAAAVPAGAQFLSEETEDGLRSFHFWDAAKGEVWSVTIDPETNAVTDVESELVNSRGSKNVTLKDADVRAVIAAVHPDATIKAVSLVTDDGVKEYRVLLSAQNWSGEITVNPESGAILDRDLVYGVTANTSKQLTQAEAKDLVLARLNSGRIVSIRKTKDDGRTVYEGTAVAGSWEYEFEIDVKTGVFLEWERERARSTAEPTSGSGGGKANAGGGTSGLIGTAKAKSIALKRAGGGSVTSIRLERDDGIQVYDGKIVYGNYEYEFEINAQTGAIREWDAERIRSGGGNNTDRRRDDDDDDDDDHDDHDDDDDDDDDDD